MNTGNTAFCIFEPFAEGLAPDTFPAEESVFYGSRVGNLYPYCISRASDPPLDSDRYEPFRRKRVSFIRSRRLEDKGETDVDHELIERIIWEGDHGKDGPGLARIMRGLAARHPLVEGAEDSLPVLPLMPDLTQAINMGATDSRAVVAIVQPAEGEDLMSAHMHRLLFEEGIAGRLHAVRVTAAEWEMAKKQRLVRGSELEAGICLVVPELFGRHGKVGGEVGPASSLVEIRRCLTDELDEFSRTWRKPPRPQQIRMGVKAKISWREWDPATEGIIDIATREDG